MSSNNLTKIPNLLTKEEENIILYRRKLDIVLICSFIIYILSIILITEIYPRYVYNYDIFVNSYDKFVDEYNSKNIGNPIIKDEFVKVYRYNYSKSQIQANKAMYTKISKLNDELYDKLRKYIETTDIYKNTLEYKSKYCYRTGKYTMATCYWAYDDTKIKDGANKLLDSMVYENLKYEVTSTELFMYKNKKLLPKQTLSTITKVIGWLSGFCFLFSGMMVYTSNQ